MRERVERINGGAILREPGGDFAGFGFRRGYALRFGASASGGVFEGALIRLEDGDQFRIAQMIHAIRTDIELSTVRRLNPIAITNPVPAILASSAGHNGAVADLIGLFFHPKEGKRRRSKLCALENMADRRTVFSFFHR
jgi:hypothetical protein